MLVNVAVGYGGRREIADAVRSLLSEHAAKGTTLEELAGLIDPEHIADHQKAARAWQASRGMPADGYLPLPLIVELKSQAGVEALAPPVQAPPPSA